MESISKPIDRHNLSIKTATSKMEKAKELGIPVLTELAFIKMFVDIDEFWKQM